MSHIVEIYRQTTFTALSTSELPDLGGLSPLYSVSIPLGTPNGIRTRDTNVKGWGLNRLSMGAYKYGGNDQIRTGE